MKKFVAALLCILITAAFSGCSRFEDFAQREKPQYNTAHARESETTQNASVDGTASAASSPSAQLSKNETGGENTNESKKDMALSNITLCVNGAEFSVNLEDNETAREFADMLKDGGLSIEMSDYGGFEKVGSLGRELTADDVNMTTEAGDIVLYNGSNIVMFYGSNTWDYTKIGSAEDTENFKDALGDGDVTATFSVVD